ncbi:MAG: 50S ribosomal protein L11 methyltransferase [Lachnospiraceae bacterium]|nr:50S ribosomal protein L11 methyltransferase [Lachnospiraceae bacterium]
MKWTKVEIITTTEAVDLIYVMLDDLGIEGIQIEDNIPLTQEEKDMMFIDFLPELPEDDGTAKVNFYVDVKGNNPDSDNESNKVDDMEAFIGLVREGLDDLKTRIDIGEGKITIEDTEDKDWLNNWKAFFKPFRVAEDIIIKPTWETLQDKKDDDIVIEIDPGTAFGTGSHETTRLCISALRKYIKENTTILDVGCGSGILSIISLKLGAKHVTGVDIDKAAITATYENMEVNNVSKDSMSVYLGNILEDEDLVDELDITTYDIVVANILADVIMPLSDILKDKISEKTLFISSGIIDIKKDEVKERLEANGFSIIEVVQMGDWYSYVCKK